MLTIKYFLDNQEIPLYKPTRPSNSVINIILHRDTKGVSNLYKCMYYHNCDILGNICAKWYDRGSLIFSTHDVRNSFVRTHALIDDIYLEYIQFRTLHYRFFTNDLLLKIKIKDTDLCSICNSEKDSNCHMLVTCKKVCSLCKEVEAWIRNLGMEGYHLTDRRKIIGDLENSGQINIIILNTKKTIFLSKCDGTVPTIYNVKHNVQQFFLHERYKAIINNKEHSFRKKWSLFTNIIQ